jgi:hypothetical protein
MLEPALSLPYVKNPVSLRDGNYFREAVYLFVGIWFQLHCWYLIAESAAIWFQIRRWYMISDMLLAFNFRYAAGIWFQIRCWDLISDTPLIYDFRYAVEIWFQRVLLVFDFRECCWYLISESAADIWFQIWCWYFISDTLFRYAVNASTLTFLRMMTLFL